MKNLHNLPDKYTVYRVEAIRISYLIVETAFIELTNNLRQFEENPTNVRLAVEISRNVWQFIDYSHRFSRLLGNIRGLKHNEARYTKLHKSTPEIEKARNFHQHLNEELPNVTTTTYPILGAVLWSSENGLISYSVSLGALPPGTQLKSQLFDTQTNTYSKDISLDAATFSLNLSRVDTIIKSAWDYFCEWLDERKALADDELIPNFFSAGPLDGIPRGSKYARVLFTVNKHSSVG